MRWPFVFAIHTLCVVDSTTAKDCLLNSPLEFQDQKDGDRKLVTLSGTQLTITPIGSADRLSILQLYFVVLAGTLSFAMRCARLFLWLLAIHCFHHTCAHQNALMTVSQRASMCFCSLRLYIFMYIYSMHCGTSTYPCIPIQYMCDANILT